MLDGAIVSQRKTISPGSLSTYMRPATDWQAKASSRLSEDWSHRLIVVDGRQRNQQLR